MISLTTVRSSATVLLGCILLSTGCSPGGDLEVSAVERSTPGVFGNVDIADPLGDAVPGLGKSPKNVLRDELLGSYQAYQRELLVAGCMAESGFSYAPDLLYPRQIVSALSASFGEDVVNEALSTSQEYEDGRPSVLLARDGSVEEVLVSWDSAPAWNAAALAAADAKNKADQYTQALYGEDLTDLEQQGDGSDDGQFGMGGCFGAAWEAIPGFSELRTQIRARQQQEFSNAQAEAIKECAARFGFADVTTPGDLETFSITSESAQRDLDQAIEECVPAWDSARKAVEEGTPYEMFVEEIAGEFADEIEALSETIKLAESDSTFHAYIATARNDGPEEFGEQGIDWADASEDVDFVPLDEPYIERPRGIPAATPPPEDFLLTFIEYLDLQTGPGETSSVPQAEVFWDDTSFLVEVAGADQTVAKTPEQARFQCGEYLLVLSGGYGTEGNKIVQNPVPSDFMALVRNADSLECAEMS